MRDKKLLTPPQNQFSKFVRWIVTNKKVHKKQLTNKINLPTR
jgi:hypothetical protein